MDEQTSGFFEDTSAAPASDAPIIMPPPGGDDDFFGAIPVGADNGYIGEVDVMENSAPAPGVLVLEDPVQPVPESEFAMPPQQEYAPAEGYSSFPDEGGYAASAPDMGGYPNEMDAFAAPPASMDAFSAPPSDFPPGDFPPGDFPPGDYPPAEPIQLDASLPDPEPQQPEEPSPMAKWNQGWTVTLKDRKDSENALKAEHVEAARAELDTFHGERYAKRESKMSKNRMDEQSKLEAMELDLENDNSWQRVVKLVELQQDSIDTGNDIGRMRDVLIMLKNDAQRAAILA